MFVKSLIVSTGINNIKRKNCRDINLTKLIKDKEKVADKEYKLDNQIEN